jgi:hypothetical protein
MHIIIMSLMRMKSSLCMTIQTPFCGAAFLCPIATLNLGILLKPSGDFVGWRMPFVTHTLIVRTLFCQESLAGRSSGVGLRSLLGIALASSIGVHVNAIRTLALSTEKAYFSHGLLARCLQGHTLVLIDIILAARHSVV